MHRRTFLSASAASLAAFTAKNTLRGDDQTSPGDHPSPRRHPLLVTRHSGIQKVRDAALAILKPTRAQLEHGLDLHRQSVVFDSYGFAPRAAIDGDQYAAAFKAGASDQELADMNEDMRMTRPAIDPAERAEFQEAFRCAGVTCIFQNAGEEGQDIPRLLKRLARFTFLTDMLRDTLIRATLPQDIPAAKAQGKHCLYLTGNGIPLRQNWISVQDELSDIRTFFEMGIRMMHLTYNRRNMLGDGCAETANGGLSDFGRTAIAEMNRVGVIVDVAHSGWQTSLEAAQVSTRPMVASHSVCHGLNPHIRSKPDEVIRAICETGGLIGICCIPPFLAGTGDIAALLDHIDYVVKNFGIDHVAIGTDVAHTSKYSKEQNAKVPRRSRKRRTRFGALWPAGALGGNWPRRASLGWTNWPLFTVGLVQRGYTDAEIQKIIGGNILRVCQDVLPEELRTPTKEG